MSEKPNALRLADALEGKRLHDDSVEWMAVLDEAAAELRRLHEAREQDRRAIREALEALASYRRELSLLDMTAGTQPCDAENLLRQRLEQP